MRTKILFVIICIVGLIIIAFYSYKRFTTNRAAQLTTEIYAVWAAQGPFKSGDESAKAMKYAHAAVRGIETIDEPIIIEAIQKHSEAYNANPKRWESIRQEALLSAKGEKYEKHIELARKYAAREEHIDNIVK